MSNSNSIIQSFFQVAEEKPHKTAIIWKEDSISYVELRQWVNAYAHYFKTAGVNRGDSVLFHGQSSIRFSAIYLACHFIGAIAVPLDARMAPAERNVLHQKIKPALALFPSSLEASFPFEELNKDIEMHRPEVAGFFPGSNEIADILFTTGTTGSRKGVQLTHENIFAGAANSNVFIGNTPHDKEIIPLPLHHAFGLRRLRVNLMMGATAILEEGFMFPQRFFDHISEGATGLCMVPTGFQVMKKLMKDRYIPHFRKLRYIEFGSMPMPAEQKRELAEQLPSTRICMHYGLTEVAANIFTEFHDDIDYLDTLGKPSPNVDVAIMNESMISLPNGEIGEIAVRGSIQTPGYWNDPERSHQVLVNGWFKTGDLGLQQDSGHIQMKGRNDDVMNIGGKKVFPQEIEHQIQQHPSVQDCACVSIENDLLGEQIHAFIISRSEQLSRQEWVPFLRESLDSYKIPAQFTYVDSIPYTSTGKKKREALITERALKKPGISE